LPLWPLLNAIMAAFVLYFQSFRHQPRSIRHDIAFLVGTASGKSSHAQKEKLIKIGAKIVSHGRYVVFQMAEVAIPRNLFADMVMR
jgi:hypothetical protein